MNQSLKLEELARTTLPDSRDVFALQQGNPAVLKWCYGFGVQLGMKFFLTLITQSLGTKRTLDSNTLNKCILIFVLGNERIQTMKIV